MEQVASKQKMLTDLPQLLVERFGRGLTPETARRRIAMGRVWIDGVVCRELEIEDPGDAKIELGDGLPYRGEHVLLIDSSLRSGR